MDEMTMSPDAEVVDFRTCHCGREFETDTDDEICERCGIIQEAATALRWAAKEMQTLARGHRSRTLDQVQHRLKQQAELVMQQAAEFDALAAGEKEESTT
jgi:hypothetical protein